MSTFIWAIIAGLLAVSLEFLFKRGWGWADHFYLFIPAGILLNYCIYRLVTSGHSDGMTWLVALATFNLATVITRAALSQWVVGEPLVKGNLLAAALLVFAVIGGRFWK